MSADICQGKYLCFLLPPLTGSLLHLEEFKFLKAPIPRGGRDLGHSKTPAKTWYPIESQYLSDPTFHRPCAGKCPTVFLMCQCVSEVWILSGTQKWQLLYLCAMSYSGRTDHTLALSDQKMLRVFESLSYWFFPPKLNLFQEVFHTHISSPLKLYMVLLMTNSSPNSANL